MTPYGLFSFCQKCQQRSAGTIAKFNESQYYPFFAMLIKYFENDLKFDGDTKIKQFVSVCAKYTENRFDPFKLNSGEYLEIFTSWYKVHANTGAYYININESFNNIYKFCDDKDIKTIEEYVRKWAVSHLISGVLNENVAYALGVHNLELSKPEKLSINKRFLKHADLIKERIDRDAKLRTVLKEGLEDLKNKLIWRQE